GPTPPARGRAPSSASFPTAEKRGPHVENVSLSRGCDAPAGHPRRGGGRPRDLRAPGGEPRPGLRVRGDVVLLLRGAARRGRGRGGAVAPGPAPLASHQEALWGGFPRSSLRSAS